MINTATGKQIDSSVVCDYFRSLVNRFFKILPMREQNEESLCVYVQSLQLELIGCMGFVDGLRADAEYMTLLSILQYMIDNPECSVTSVKREVFRAISIINKIKAYYLSN